jgi:hypothetical protein
MDGVYYVECLELAVGFVEQVALEYYQLVLGQP